MPDKRDAEYIEFRDSLYQERFKTEMHYHHSYYTEDGELERTCARCHRDLTDEHHFREQVTMAAELNQPASQAAENIPELDVKLEQDVAK